MTISILLVIVCLLSCGNSYVITQSTKRLLTCHNSFFGNLQKTIYSEDKANRKDEKQINAPVVDLPVQSFDINIDNDNSPAVLTDDICLLPGEPVVRIEDAPSNARRIFTGIDILAKIDQVWEVLTTYEKLQEVVPSLVKNEVVSRNPRGARLLQVGGAKVLPGVTFTAKTVLDIVTYLEDQVICPVNLI